MKAMLAIALAVAPTSAAFAQRQTCEAYIGQTVAPSTFDSVAVALKHVPTAKGEYETTAAYEARLAAARGSSPTTAVIAYRFNPEYLKYNADTGSLDVVSYALQNTNTNYSNVFGYGTSYDNKVRYNSFNNIDLVISESETITGRYIGQNAFGVRATIYKKLRVTRTVFEDEGKFGESLWPNSDKDAKLGSIPMTIDQAKALKATGKAAVVIEPKWPFYAEGTKHWAGNLNSQTDVTNPVYVIVADIQCGLLLSATNRVVGAFPTR